jgi:ferredoxin-NADP reductase
MGVTVPIATKRLRVTRIIKETAGTKSFQLECKDGVIEYKSGQFLTFLFKNRSGADVRRSYSISSSPELNEPLTITVKRIDNGEFSRMFIERTGVGDILHTIGASGFFILPEKIDQVQKIVFLTAGSGIVPAFSLIKTILHLHPSVKVYLVYSNKSEKETVFHKELTELRKKFPASLVIEFLYSISQDLSRSRLNPESLEVILAEHNITIFGNTLFYVCGPGGYMRMINFSLTRLGVPAKHIKREIFHVQQPSIVNAPSDTKPHTVTILNQDRKDQFTVQYPVTILQAAKLLHINIPYSCENGQCGTCVAKCLKGTVWMAGNEVLLDEERAAGFVLTCTGYPVNGDVTLRI